MDRYFKKPSGAVIKYDPSNHNLDSLKSRFKECNAGGVVKKPKAKKKK